VKRNNVNIIGALLVMAVCLASAAPAMAADWEQFHYDIANTGTTSSDAPDTNKILWVSADIGAVMNSQAMIVGDVVYVYADNKVYALSKCGGNELWNVSIPGDSLSYDSWASPAYSNGMLYVSSGYNLTKIAANGTKMKEIAFPDGGYSCNGGPTVANGVVFAGSGSGVWPSTNPGNYYAFYSNNLAPKWNVAVNGNAVSTPAVADNKVVFGEYIWGNPSKLYCVNESTGTEIWNTTLSKDICGSAAIDAANNRVYVTTYGDGLLHAINFTDGNEDWNVTIQQSDSTPAISGDYIYVSGSNYGSGNGRTYCFNSAGVEQWNVSCGSWTMSPAIANGKLFTGTAGASAGVYPDPPVYSDGVCVYDALTGTPVWSYDHAGSSPSIANSDAIAVSIGIDGKVYAFGPSNATVYFEPSDIRVPEYCNTETVGVWINSSDALGSGTIIFDYTFCCANVTDFAQDPVNFPGLPGEIITATLTPGKVKIDFATALPAGFPANVPVRLGNMTIHCCNPSDFCMTDLTWNRTDPGVNLMDAGDVAITPVKYEDGTFACNIPDLVVTRVKGTGNDTHYTVEYTVKNVGKAAAGNSTVKLDADGAIYTMDVLGLGVGCEQDYTFTDVIALTDGADELLVCADCDDEIVELYETNNCMIGRYPGEVVISIQPAVTYVQPQDQFDVKVHVDTKGMDVYAVQYRLTYNTSVVRAETQTKDPFLGPLSETMVIVNEIDQPHGEASYAETRTVSGGVNESDNVTNVHFIAIGVRGATTNLTLDDIIISDEDGVPIAYVIEHGAVEITENTPPVPIGVSKHRINNVAQKYQCISTLCSCSYDPDYPGKGGNISYIRWAFGDGQYGTSEGLSIENCTCKEHRYESWQWDPLGDPAGGYMPFDVQLEVTDDGCPEITNATNFTINVYIAGDANGDGKVNVLDAVWVGKYWRETCCTSPPCYLCGNCEGYLWNSTLLSPEDNEHADGADLNNDCKINVLDAVIIGANWRHTAW